jgi:predicted nucleotidyltransferase
VNLDSIHHTELECLISQNLPGVSVWAYGSRVHGTSNLYSDLDLVVFANPDQRSAVGNLCEALEESSLPFVVDLHVWDDLPAAFQANIESEHVVLF